MAKWTDEFGVYHDTDNLEYGNQGDTRYWSGTPGAVGSQSYDRPMPEDVKKNTEVSQHYVNWTVTDPTKPSITWSQPAPPGQGYDLSKGYTPIPGMTFATYEDAMKSLAQIAAAGQQSGSQTVQTVKGPMTVDFLKSELQKAGYGGPWTTNEMVAAFNRAASGTKTGTGTGTGAGAGTGTGTGAGAGKPAAAGGTPKTAQPVVTATIPHGNPALNDTVYSELAARALAQIEGTSVEQARTRLQQIDPAKKQFLVQAASSGVLDYLAPELGGGKTGTQNVLDEQAQNMGYSSWKEFMDKLAAGAQAQAEMEKKKAEQELQLARNADERAQAYLKLQEANQKLNELKFEDSKRQFAAQLMQSLLGTATQLRGPRDYAQFQQYISGGRNLWTSLLGNQPMPRFTAPSGSIEPVSIEDLLQQLGIMGGGAQQAAQTQQIPLPHQINPVVWDSLGSVGQQLVLSGAEAAGYDPQEFLRQMKAARPLGTASRRTVYTFAAPAAA